MSFGSKNGDKTNVPALGFLLVGLNSYDSTNYGGKTADVLRSGSLPNGETKINLVLRDNGGAEVDKTVYGSSSIAEAGESLERKAWQSGGCISSQSSGEFLGNGCDTDSNTDFEVRAKPNPQNSASLPEPRGAPSINNFQAIYNFSPEIDFSWDLSADALGATSTNTYYIYEVKNGSSTPIFQSAPAISSRLSINAIGRDYNFEFKVQDRDGLAASATSTVRAKSFLNKFYFYADPRSSSAYLFDLTVSSQHPLWSVADSPNDVGWDGIVFYLNEDALGQGILTQDNNLLPDNKNFLRVKYSSLDTQKPLLVVGQTSPSCSQGKDLADVSFCPADRGDNRFYIFTASSTSDIKFSPSDYVTLVFYGDGGKSGMFGPHLLSLAAVDRTKYYFQNNPPTHEPPSSPASVQTSFDDLHSLLNIRWSTSTDPDSVDNSLVYEFNITSSSALNENGWRSLGSSLPNNLSASAEVAFPNSYKIGIRASDDFGDKSEPNVVNWNFPDGFQSLPFQKDHGRMLGRANGSGQKFFSQASATVDRVALWLGPEGGNFNHSDVFVKIQTDSGGSLGEIIASSTSAGLRDVDNPSEITFRLNSPVSLAASSSYWIVPAISSGNGAFVFGSSGNGYSNGFWSDSPGADAYFYLGK